MKKLFILITVVSFFISCRNEKTTQVSTGPAPEEAIPSGFVLVAKDIVTEVIVRPDTTGDPWEVEKVAGYKGEAMINGIFESIYKGTLIVKDYHTGEVLTASDIRSVEKKFNNDRSRIGKLSFTEDWYYDPIHNTVRKKVKSFAFGYERLDNDGKVLGYNAVFVVETAK